MIYGNQTIRNHTCERFLLFLEKREYGCQPTIDSDGQISGCDDSHPMLISFCPFCGEQLPPFPESNEYRKVTDEGIISYGYND